LAVGAEGAGEAEEEDVSRTEALPISKWRYRGVWEAESAFPGARRGKGVRLSFDSLAKKCLYACHKAPWWERKRRSSSFFTPATLAPSDTDPLTPAILFIAAARLVGGDVAGRSNWDAAVLGSSGGLPPAACFPTFLCSFERGKSPVGPARIRQP